MKRRTCFREKIGTQKEETHSVRAHILSDNISALLQPGFGARTGLHVTKLLGARVETMLMC